VSTWGEVFLGVIAVATLAIAVVQVGVVVVAGRLARRVEALADRLEQDVKPLFGHLDSVGRDASRAAALATAQVERADKLFGDLAVRIDAALNTVQTSLTMPAREGRALLSGFKAALQALRELRQNAPSRQSRSDDEEALFI
jgi:hypothetical protein